MRGYSKVSVKLPDAKNKLTRTTRGSTTYIRYEVSRTYKPETQLTYPKRILIGKLVGKERMLPNRNYFEYFGVDEESIKDTFCKDVAKFFVDDGIENSFEGNWMTDTWSIADKFGVEKSIVDSLAPKIRDAISEYGGDRLLDLLMYKDEKGDYVFDIMIGLDYLENYVDTDDPDNWDYVY